MDIVSYPPPPPPPPPSSKRSKILIVAIIIAFAVVVFVGGYYAMTLTMNNNGSSTSVSPSPSATSSASPTSTPSVTATPGSSGQSSVGYRVGAWANYTMKNYDENGDVTARYNIRYAVDQGTSKGVDCWLLQTEMELSSEGSVMKTITTYLLDKSSLQGLHYKIQVYLNGIVISTTENDYSPGDVNNIPTAINPSVIIGQETITVPAGTFNCDKATTTTTDLGTTYVTTVWGNSNIPVVGLVKQELTSSGVLISATELIAYGG
jgi:hypothetical protein